MRADALYPVICPILCGEGQPAALQADVSFHRTDSGFWSHRVRGGGIPWAMGAANPVWRSGDRIQPGISADHFGEHIEFGEYVSDCDIYSDPEADRSVSDIVAGVLAMLYDYAGNRRPVCNGRSLVQSDDCPGIPDPLRDRNGGVVYPLDWKDRAVEREYGGEVP